MHQYNNNNNTHTIKTDTQCRHSATYISWRTHAERTSQSRANFLSLSTRHHARSWFEAYEGLRTKPSKPSRASDNEDKSASGRWKTPYRCVFSEWILWNFWNRIASIYFIYIFLKFIYYFFLFYSSYKLKKSGFFAEMAAVSEQMSKDDTIKMRNKYIGFVYYNFFLN